MDLTGVRSEPHVAQHSRREKLREKLITSIRTLRTDDTHHRSDAHQIQLPSEFTPDLDDQVLNVCNANSLFAPSFLSSKMIGFPSDFNALSAESDSIVRQRVEENALINSPSQSSPSNFNLSSKVNQQASDLMLNYGSHSWSTENNQNPIFPGEAAIVSAHHPYLNPSYIQLYTFSSDNFPETDRRKHAEDSQFLSPPFQNALQDVIIPDSIRTPENIQGRWSSAGELANFPSSKVQEDLSCFESSSNWVDRSVENSTHQGLSLSLSSIPSSKLLASQLEGCSTPEDLEQRGGFYKDHRDSVAGISMPSAISKRYGKSVQEIIGVSSNTRRSTGPLGPFTGYTIILKSSKFLKPAQQLLDQICGRSGLKSGKTSNVSERTSGEVSGSAAVDVFDVTETEAVAKGCKLAASSSILYGSRETFGVKAGSFSSESVRSDIQQKKAKLQYIMEEVCRRYRQYNQQMQMALSSFESVAGLGSATPFMSFALKIVSRHFSCLKNVILEQLRHARRGPGDELISQREAEGSSVKMGGVEQSLEKYSYGGGEFGLLQPHEHVWKPQRGLPERAVSILKSWLFEHFLHPYPSDADKHLLATQTGLSRNQVSNWFINARVRVWKPMVEEIHVLETNETHDRNDKSESCSQMNPDHRQKNPGLIDADDDSYQGQKGGTRVSQWWSSQEKRSRLESEASPSSFNEPVVGFMPYQRSQLGGVSLTLGLRHGAENSQQQLLLEQQDQLRRQCGGYFLHDFVG